MRSRLAHPGVATIYDFDSQHGVEFLVMELVPGGTLETRIASGPLSIDELVRIGALIGDALGHAHTCGFMHRDLKPGNVVLTQTGHPKILDFGLALLLGGGKTTGKLTQQGMILGSLPSRQPISGCATRVVRSSSTPIWRWPGRHCPSV